MTTPNSPVYVISKGRWSTPYTANFLDKYGVGFRVVVEPTEVEEYRLAVGDQRVLSLPFSNLGLGGIPARNWVWEHSISMGAKWHWILDDNIADFRRRVMVDGKVKRRVYDPGDSMLQMEKFVEGYENVGIAGPNYSFFATDGQKTPPFRLNAHVYSCLLIRNELPFRWRGRYNEDTDLCLQALSLGWCTIQFQAYLIMKKPTMTVKGGNTAELYQGDGRLRMARSLERVWPGVVTVDRRFGRPQHVVDWRRFRGVRLIRKGDSAACNESAACHG